MLKIFEEPESLAGSWQGKIRGEKRGESSKEKIKCRQSLSE